MSTSVTKRVILQAFLANVALILIKIGVGILSGSAALIAEGVHSVRNVVTGATVLSGFRQSHTSSYHFPYKQAPPLWSCLVGILLMIVSYYLITANIFSLREGATVAGGTAVGITLLVLILKELTHHHMDKAASKVGSHLLAAEALQQRQDMFPLVFVLIGAGGSRLGYPVLDSLIALCLSVLVLRQGITLCRSALGSLLETSPDKATIREVRQIINTLPGVEEIHAVYARKQGIDLYIEIHIGINPAFRIKESHTLAKEVKTTIMREFPEVSHVAVHLQKQNIRAVRA